MHRLFLPPVGWGFMLIHRWYPWGATVVTDGGSLPSCFHETYKTLGSFLKELRPFNAWAWILSHLDSDHYSIITHLIRIGIWFEPKLVILPCTYALIECRDAMAKFHELAVLLAFILRNKLRNKRKSKRMAYVVPSFKDLVKILSTTSVVGVRQGSRLQARELLYHIIWPSATGITELQCRELCKELFKKLCGKVRKFEEYVDRHEKEKLEAAKERVMEELAKLLKVFASMKVIDYLDLDNELTSKDETNYELNRDCDNKFTIMTNEYLDISAEHLNYRYIYIEAAKVLEDSELIQLYMTMVNTFSIAYALEYISPECKYPAIPLTYWVSIHHDWDLLVIDLHRLLYKSSANKSKSSGRTLVLYPSDLGEDSLRQAINYYKNFSQKVLIEIAPHHGNVYSNCLRLITPSIIFIPRCDNHVNPSIRGNFEYGKRYHDAPQALKLTSNHEHGLLITL